MNHDDEPDGEQHPFYAAGDSADDPDDDMPQLVEPLALLAPHEQQLTLVPMPSMVYTYSAEHLAPPVTSSSPSSRDSLGSSPPESPYQYEDDEHAFDDPASGAGDTRRREPRGSNARKHDDSYIPRPPNAFILFRSAFIRSQKISGKVEGNNSTLSKIIGQCWRSLPKEERAEWEQKAIIAQAEHRRKYPDWRFRPGANALAKERMRGKARPRRKDKDRDKDGDRDWGPGEDGEGDGPEGPSKGKRASAKGKGKAKAKGKGKGKAPPKKDKRVAKIADLLSEGKTGRELEEAVEEWDRRRQNRRGREEDRQLRQAMKLSREEANQGQYTSGSAGPSTAPQFPLSSSDHDGWEDEPMEEDEPYEDSDDDAGTVIDMSPSGVSPLSPQNVGSVAMPLPIADIKAEATEHSSAEEIPTQMLRRSLSAPAPHSREPSAEGLDHSSSTIRQRPPTARHSRTRSHATPTSAPYPRRTTYPTVRTSPAPSLRPIAPAPVPANPPQGSPAPAVASGWGQSHWTESQTSHMWWHEPQPYPGVQMSSPVVSSPLASSPLTSSPEDTAGPSFHPSHYDEWAMPASAQQSQEQPVHTVRDPYMYNPMPVPQSSFSSLSGWAGDVGPRRPGIEHVGATYGSEDAFRDDPRRADATSAHSQWYQPTESVQPLGLGPPQHFRRDQHSQQRPPQGGP